MENERQASCEGHNGTREQGHTKVGGRKHQEDFLAEESSWLDLARTLNVQQSYPLMKHTGHVGRPTISLEAMPTLKLLDLLLELQGPHGPGQCQ